MQVPWNTPKTTLICSKNTKKFLISPFLRSQIILLPEYNFWHADQLQKNWQRGKYRGTLPKLLLFAPKIRKKNSNFAVFDIANNFIAGIPFLARRIAVKKLATNQVPRNTPKTTLICSKYTKKILITPFLRSPIILLPKYHYQHTASNKRNGNDASTAEHPQNYTYLLQKYEKNYNFAVFEIANNSIAGIPVLAHSLAVKNWQQCKYRGTSPKLPLFAPKIRK